MAIESKGTRVFKKRAWHLEPGERTSERSLIGFGVSRANEEGGNPRKKEKDTVLLRRI